MSYLQAQIERARRDLVTPEVAGLRLHGSRHRVASLARKLAAQNWCDETGLCQHNLGLSRDKMPQLEADQIPGFLGTLLEDGIRVTTGVMPVGNLRATQGELNAEKVQGMVDSARKGEGAFLIETPVIVSGENYILDGHHRWAALLTISERCLLPVFKVRLPIHELLKRALDYEGSTKKDLNDRAAMVRYAVHLAKWHRQLGIT